MSNIVTLHDVNESCLIFPCAIDDTCTPMYTNTPCISIGIMSEAKIHIFKLTD